MLFSSECSTPCTGDGQQLCGGDNRLTMYGPPPLAGAAEEHNGVVQECKPWCFTGDDMVSNQA